MKNYHFEQYKKDVPNLKIKKVENIEELLKSKELKIITGSLYMIGEICAGVNFKTTKFT